MTDVLHEQLIDRRRRLESALWTTDRTDHLTLLLSEVDAALARMNDGTYGACEACQDAIETDRLLANPLERFCLDHLSPAQQRALEQDLELAAKIQMGLLPRKGANLDGWQAGYHYQPASVVSGDYCDFLPGPGRSLYFMLGDVSGKGVAASLLMSHLHAMFRAMIPLGLSLKELVERASRVFCEITLPTHYATLTCGRAEPDGTVELCNAGNPRPVLLRGQAAAFVEVTGLPVGIFCNEEFSSVQFPMSGGESLVLYTDGISEALDPSGEEYGNARLLSGLTGTTGLSAQGLVDACIADLKRFRRTAVVSDDVTLLALQRTGGGG